MKTKPKLRVSKRLGSFSIDALTAIFVASLGAAALYTLVPMIDKSQVVAREDSIASQLCNRFIEQLRLLKPKDINFTTLRGLNLVDPSPSVAPTYSFTNIPLDDASKYSPAQTLKNATGTLTVVQLAGRAVELRVALSWKSTSGKTRSYQTGTILGGYR